MKLDQLKVGAILSYVALGLGIIITFVFTRFMIDTLGTSEYGLFILVLAIISYLTVLDFGFGNAIVRYTAKYKAEQNIVQEEKMLGMFWILYIGLGVLSFVLVIIMNINFKSFFAGSMTDSEIEIARVLMWLAGFNMAMSFPFSIFTSIITAYERFIFLKVLNLIRQIANPVMMVIALLFGYKAIGMIVVVTALNILFNLISWIYCKRKIKVRIHFSGIDVPLFKEISKYSFFVFIALIVDRVYWGTGQLLIAKFINPASVAVFGIGMQFVNVFYMPMSTAISGVFLPKLTAISLEDTHEKKLSDIFIKVGRIQLIILSLIMSGFIMYGQSFIKLWLGDLFAESYYISLILMIPLTIPLAQSIGISILQARNLHAFRSIIYLIIAVANIIISIIFIQLFGVIGGAVGTAVSLIAGQIVIMNIYYKRKINIDIFGFWKEVFKLMPAILLTCGIGLVFKYFVPSGSWLFLIINVVFFTLVYLVAMYFIGINQYEKDLFVTPVKQLLGKLLKRGGAHD